MAQHSLTPEFLETQRREIMAEGASQSNADQHLADFLSRDFGDESEFTQKYSTLSDDPREISAFLDWSAYGTTEPTERFGHVEPPSLGERALSAVKEGITSLPGKAVDVGLAINEFVGEQGEAQAPTIGFIAGSALGGPPGAVTGAVAGKELQIGLDRLRGEEVTPLEELEEVGTEALTAATIEAVFGIGGAALKGIAKTKPIQGLKKMIMEVLPEREISSLIKPVFKDTTFGKNPSKAIVEEGIVANTRGGLLKKVVTKRSQVGKELGKVIERSSNASPKQIDMTDMITKPIVKAIRAADKQGNTATVSSLNSFLTGQTGLAFDVKTGRLIVSGRGKAALTQTPFGVWKQKTEIAAGIQWTEEAVKTGINKAKFEVLGNLKNGITGSVKQSRDLMRRYANLVSAENSVKRQVHLQARKNIIGFSDIVVSGATFGGSLATGDSLSESTGKAVIADTLLKLSGSTGVKTATAQLLGNKLPSLLRSAVKNLNPAARAAFFEFLSGDEKEE